MLFKEKTDGDADTATETSVSEKVKKIQLQSAASCPGIEKPRIGNQLSGQTESSLTL